MKMKTLVTALALTMAGLAMAQPATPNLDKREANQQQRIDQGVASGQLNAKETNRLDKREAKLAANEAVAKADGKVTRAERRKLQHEANRNSKAIYKQKHDAQTAK
jgi:tellurite resistance protein